MYDGIMHLELPVRTTLIGYADDLALVIIARRVEQVLRAADEVIVRNGRCMQTNGLEIVLSKTKAIRLVGRRKISPMGFTVMAQEVRPSKVFRYLGVTLDASQTFAAHVADVSSRAARVTSVLSRMMPNIGGPKPNMRKLLVSVANSILLYAAPIWVGAMSVSRIRQVMASVQRRTVLRVCSAYRTVSEQVIALSNSWQRTRIVDTTRKL